MRRRLLLNFVISLATLCACGGSHSNAPSEYTLGGTVSGATGSLVLKNGNESLTVPGDGSFTFSSALAVGAKYDVVITTMPTGQRCSVRNGTGTIGNSNVINLFVNCATPNLAVLAGNTAGPGYLNGASATARFVFPSGVAVDSAGNLYIAEPTTETIRKVTPAGQVTTVAGTPGIPGFADGIGSAASFAEPVGVAVDAAGNVYVTDSDNSAIRKISPEGAVTTLTNSIRFGEGIAVDAAGNLYVAVLGDMTIRKVSPSGVVTLLAGTPGIGGSADGAAATATFLCPIGVAVDSAGNVYVADGCNNNIRKITPAAVVSTLAGTAGIAGSANGTGAAASFSGPSAISVDGAGNLYVLDSGNNLIRQITPTAVVTTIAGSAAPGAADGAGAAAQFNLEPFTFSFGHGNYFSYQNDYSGGIAADVSGNLYVTDIGNSTVRAVSPGGMVTTLAGSAPASGSTDGSGSTARFYRPLGIVVDPAGNAYVADAYNSTIRKISASGAVSTLAGTPGVFGHVDGVGATAQFAKPEAIALDASGNLYIADSADDTIRKITPGAVVSTLAGSAYVGGSADGAGAAASFSSPSGIAVDSLGDVYVVDSGNNTVRKISPGGVVTTFAGSAGGATCCPADGVGAAARFSRPVDAAIDPSGNLYVSDLLSQSIRKITPGAVVTTIGIGGGLPVGVEINVGLDYEAGGIAVDATGNVYVANTVGSSIYKVTPAGTATTVVGVRDQVGFLPGPVPGAIVYPARLALFGNTLYLTMPNAVVTVTPAP